MIDIQEKLFVAIDQGARVEANVGLLIDVADALDMPVIITEHMTDKIGKTLPNIRERLNDSAIVIAKSHFSASDEPTFIEAINRLAGEGRNDFLITGMEAHVCVQQTALGLHHLGHTVRVAADAVGSRDPGDLAVSLDRMRGRGCDIVTAESIAFEWLERGDSPAFKKMLRIIKNRRVEDDD